MPLGLVPNLKKIKRKTPTKTLPAFITDPYYRDKSDFILENAKARNRNGIHCNFSSRLNTNTFTGRKGRYQAPNDLINSMVETLQGQTGDTLASATSASAMSGQAGLIGNFFNSLSSFLSNKDSSNFTRNEGLALKEALKFANNQEPSLFLLNSIANKQILSPALGGLIKGNRPLFANQITPPWITNTLGININLPTFPSITDYSNLLSKVPSNNLFGNKNQLQRTLSSYQNDAIKRINTLSKEIRGLNLNQPITRGNRRRASSSSQARDAYLNLIDNVETTGKTIRINPFSRSQSGATQTIRDITSSFFREDPRVGNESNLALKADLQDVASNLLNQGGVPSALINQLNFEPITSEARENGFLSSLNYLSNTCSQLRTLALLFDDLNVEFDSNNPDKEYIDFLLEELEAITLCIALNNKRSELDLENQAWLLWRRGETLLRGSSLANALLQALCPPGLNLEKRC